MLLAKIRRIRSKGGCIMKKSSSIRLLVTEQVNLI